jgi:PAS domain S-box-containing protein
VDGVDEGDGSPGETPRRSEGKADDGLRGPRDDVPLESFEAMLVLLNEERAKKAGSRRLHFATDTEGSRESACDRFEVCEARFRELFNNMDDAVAVYEAKDGGADFIIKDLNRAAELTEKVKRELVVGRGILEVFPGCGGDFGVFDALRRVWSTGIPEKLPAAFYRDDRMEGWRENYIYKAPSGEVVAIYHDVTARQLFEDALRASERRYRAIVEDQTELISRSAPDGTLTFVNDAYCRYYDETRENLIGNSFWHHVIEEDWERLVKHLQSLSREKPVETIEHCSMLSNGEIRWQRWTDRAIFDDDGSIVEIQSVGHDITERKLHEQQLQRLNEQLMEEHDRRRFLSKSLIDLLERDRQKIAMELHDHIGQILTTLKMDLELMGTHLNDSQAPLKARIAAAQDKAVQAIRSVKEIAYGLRPSMLDNLGLVSSIRNLIDDIKRSTDLQIHFFSQNVPKRFNQEKETTVYRVLQEAMCNVIKHARARKVFINLVKRGKLLSLSVEDDGIGFEPDKVMKDMEGKGPLGLLIMQERVVQIDGELSIESRTGKGTHVLAEIPM